MLHLTGFQSPPGLLHVYIVWDPELNLHLSLFLAEGTYSTLLQSKSDHQVWSFKIHISAEGNRRFLKRQQKNRYPLEV